ncbi:hypothetical protein [Candidatus Mycoplasma mahonii]|uniref:hypothetical protein n=1 Tax=Candidatus Mycoplasma mahonii TaxID=3004105 RepID=UPI0026EE2969|nr:hypothetical protein [Candidatus Mycoplasma mahonii]WKX02497.1 hypothetical protein O3I44_00225 [Candidatus Mycoplasma mahonii]
MSKSTSVTKYIWYKDKKMVATIFFVIALSMQIFAFFSVPVLTTIHKYTVGMMMGFYHPLFYGYIILTSLYNLFGLKIKLPYWFKISSWSYVFLVISILFISVSTGYYQSKIGWSQIGYKTWGATSNWWSQFISSNDVWVPATTNGGFISAFMYSFFSMIFSSIGALVFSIILMTISTSLLFSGSLIGLYKNTFKQKRYAKNKHVQIEEEKIDIKKIETVVTQDEDIFPFEDPFGDD